MSHKKQNSARNWSMYNKVLRNRGDITLWIDEETLLNWSVDAKTGQKGRPQQYSDTSLICFLSLKAIFRLPLRATQGLLDSLLRFLDSDLRSPDYTLVCKRQKDIQVELPKMRRRDVELEAGIDIVVDSTGVKVFGEGEWKVRQHGTVKKRLWRKLHLAINPATHMIEASELTELNVQDCHGFVALINSIDEQINTVIGDGAYDRFLCYETIEKRSGVGIFPPQKNAATSKDKVWK